MDENAADSTPTPCRSPLSRRWLFGAGGAAGGLALAAVTGGHADAAAPGTAWKLGGNPDVATDGSNFLGPTTVAPLIFKTRPSANGGLVERMRIAPGGKITMGSAHAGPVLDVTSKMGPAITASCTEPNSPSTGIAITAAGSVIGVRGDTTNGTGVYGTGYTGSYGDGTAYGCFGTGGVAGVLGIGTANTGGQGVAGTGTVGVYGYGSQYGLEGAVGPDSNGVAVYGDGRGGDCGVFGVNGDTAAVRGEGTFVGVSGVAMSYGVIGQAEDNTNTAYGVYGSANLRTGYAGYFDGNCRVNGTLSKQAGSFQIDHPLDPEHRWLSHSFVESPDMMNVYNGNVVLGADGTATVDLPDYFLALNTDFRYQLTCIGAAAVVYVATEVDTARSPGSFSIGGGTEGLKVSWQVTGIRQDDYAQAHPIVVDRAKADAEQGTRSVVPAGSRATRFDPAPVGAAAVRRPTRTATVPPRPDPVSPDVRGTSRQ